MCFFSAWQACILWLSEEGDSLKISSTRTSMIGGSKSERNTDVIIWQASLEHFSIECWSSIVISHHFLRGLHIYIPILLDPCFLSRRILNPCERHVIIESMKIWRIEGLMLILKGRDNSSKKEIKCQTFFIF